MLHLRSASLYKFIFLIFCINNIAKSQTAYFEKINELQGLSHSVVPGIERDKYGFIWLSTGNGLCRFDGKSCKVYNPTNVKTDLMGIYTFTQSTKTPVSNELYFATWHKLCRYDYNTDMIYEIKPRQLGLNFDQFEQITRIYAVNDSILAIADFPNLYISNLKSGKSIPIDLHENRLYRISSIISIPNENAFCISTYRSIYKYSLTDSTLNEFIHIPINERFGKQGISSMYFSGDSLYFDLSNKGYMVYNYAKQTITDFKRLDTLGLEGEVTGFYRNGNDLWIGTYSSGILQQNLLSQKVTHYTADDNDPNGLTSNNLLCFKDFGDNMIWIGTNKGGALTLDLRQPRFMGKYYIKNRKSALPFRNIVGLFEARDRKIWIGSWTNGFAIWDRKADTIEHISPYGPGQKGFEWHISMCRFAQLPDGSILAQNWINSLLRIERKKTHWQINDYYEWLGYKNTGLRWSGRDFLYDSSAQTLWIASDSYPFTKIHIPSNTWTSFSKDRKNMDLPENNYAWCILKYNTDEFYLGSNTLGLFRINVGTNKVTHYKPESKLHAVQVKSLYKDKEGILWIGSGGQGLIRFDPTTENFEHYNTSNGLCNNVIYGILEDNSQHLWLSTNYGISRFHKGTKIFNNFFKSDGMPDNEYSFNSALRTKDGTMMFGGYNGLVYFNPDRIYTDSILLPLAITNLSIFNKPVTIGDTSFGVVPLKTNIINTKAITLSYKHSLFTIDFSALYYREHDKIIYEYKLEGMNNATWISVPANKSQATFTNLNGGTYLFKLRAYNPDGVLTPEQTMLTITIIPPFWQTWWFYTLICLFGILVMVLVFRIRTSYLHKQKWMLEKQVAERTDQLSKKNAEVVAMSEELLLNIEQIEKQSLHIKELYEEQTDSIQVSKRIQQSILPSKTNMEQFFGPMLVFYKPKDIVSGDFYWYYRTETGAYLATIDCTGHGVSGAFMSVLGYNLLNGIIKLHPQASPGSLLGLLSKALVNALQQDSDDIHTKDSMDVSMLFVANNRLEIQFAGAGLKLYKLSSNGALEVTDGNKQAVGFQLKQQDVVFEDHVLPIQPGDTFYIFSDGLPGQFGGVDGGEKLKYSRFRDWINQMAKLPISTQETHLHTNLNQWQGNAPQTDDIMILGIRF